MPVKIGLFLSLFPYLLAIYAQASALDIQQVSRNIISSGTALDATLSGSTSPVLNLKATFAPNSTSRACWDIPIRQNLSQCAAVKLRLRCLTAGLSSEITAHLHFDGGWHSLSLSPRHPGDWEEIILPKSAFLPEQDACNSWRECDKLRFTVWPGAPGTFHWQFAAIEFMNANVKVAMIRPGLPDTAKDKRHSAALYLRNLGTALADGGLHPAVLEESDCTSDLLRQYSLLLLSSADVLQTHAQSAIAEYLKHGGRAGVFYTLPPALADVLLFPGGKFHRDSFGSLTTSGGATFSQRSSACIAIDAQKLPGGTLVRGWWNDASGRRTNWPAILSSKKGFWMTHVYMNQDPARAIPVIAAFIDEFCPGARQNGSEELLRQARFILANASRENSHAASKAALAKATEHSRQKDYTGTVAAIRQFQSSIADEAIGGSNTDAKFKLPAWRGAWINSPRGLAGTTWEQTAARLSAARINNVMPCFLTPYSAAYSSRLVATSSALNKGDDAVAECLKAAKRHNLQVHPWIKVLSIADAPQSVRDSMAAAGRLQCKRNGQTIPWLCPTNPDNRKLLKALVKEFAGKYSLAGLHFDMLRYAGSEYCYCKHCQKSFETAIGHPLKNWPDCTLEDAKLRTSWSAFRRLQITALATMLAGTARNASPSLKISAAVYPDSANARNTVGQDWTAWLQSRLVDFVCPMSYRPVASLFQGDIEREQKRLGGKDAALGKLRPGIGMTSCNLDKSEVNRQIRTVSALDLDGFALFEFTSASASELLKP